MPDHILIFGASGFIGGRLAQAARAAGLRVTCVQRSPGADAACDISDRQQVERLLAAARPGAVFNLAAQANIDRAEIERQAAYSVNVTGAANVAAACAALGLRLVHYSTDAVFDGTRIPIREDDPPSPLNYYGCTKSAGDARVSQACPSAVILRVSLALGFPAAPHTNSFLGMLRARWAEGVPVYAPEDEIRTPVDILTLCAASLELIDNPASGVFNIGSTTSIDRYGLTTRLAERMGCPAALVIPGGVPLPGRAPRHRVGILDVSKIQAALRTPMPGIDETLERALQ